MMLKSEEDTLKCKRLLSLVLPTAVILSACQRVSATEIYPADALEIVNDVESYHQIVTLKNETITEQTETYSYSATEATIFPEDALAYGSRIVKGTNIQPKKTSMYSSQEGAYQKDDQSAWQPQGTTEPVFASLTVYPYHTFVQLAEIFTEKGTVTELEEKFEVTFSGIDAAVSQEVGLLLGKFPIAHTSYDVEIIVDKETKRMDSISVSMEVEQADGNRTTTEEITSYFSKYNHNLPKER